MTTRRDGPIPADTLAWVHNELAEIKSRLAIVQQAADQSRGLATDASDKAHQVRLKVDQFDGLVPALVQLQDDLRAIREQFVRAQDDVHSLRQSREEIERRVLNDGERVRQDSNQAAHRFGELERQIQGWQDRVTSFEEHNRSNLEVAAHLLQRLEAIEGQLQEVDTFRSRSMASVSRVDTEMQRITSQIPGLQREDDVQRERTNSAFEMLRRLEAEVETVKTQTNRISRLDDRVELVQAERTRHNERLNEITEELTKVEARLNEHKERTILLEVRIGGYQDELRGMQDRTQADRDQITAYLHSLAEIEADMRKRQIIALEKEIRDVRGRAINFAEE